MGTAGTACRVPGADCTVWLGPWLEMADGLWSRGRRTREASEEFLGKKELMRDKVSRIGKLRVTSWYEEAKTSVLLPKS